MVSPELLRRHSFFGHLKEEHLVELAKIAHERHFGPGEFVFREGEPARELFVVLEGQVDTSVEIDHLGNRAVVDTLGAGDVLGWSTIVPPYRYTASGECTRASKVLAIDSAGLRRMLEADHDLAFEVYRKVIEVVARRLHATRLRLTSLLPERVVA